MSDQQTQQTAEPVSLSTVATLFKLSPQQIWVAWSFLYPMLKNRAAASQPLWDDALVETMNAIFSNQTLTQLWADVVNRDRAPEAYQQDAPEESRMLMRQSAGNINFVEGYIRDTLASMDTAKYVTPALDTKVMTFAESREAARSNMAADPYRVQNFAQAPTPGAVKPPVQSNAMEDNPPLYPPTEEQEKGPATAPFDESQGGDVVHNGTQQQTDPITNPAVPQEQYHPETKVGEDVGQQSESQPKSDSQQQTEMHVSDDPKTATHVDSVENK